MHPKLIMAGPLALAVQVRAICYASQNRTDGFLPYAIVPHLLVDIPGEDWPATMVQHRLWDPCHQGYTVHDYLHWNVSNVERQAWAESLSKAGKKGAKRRWGKGRKPHSQPYSPGDSLPNSQAIASQSTSISSLKTLNSSESDPNPKSEKQTKLRCISEDDRPSEKHFRFGQSLGIDVGPEWGKFKNYCLAHAKRYANFEAAFRNWLANAEAMKGKR